MRSLVFDDRLQTEEELKSHYKHYKVKGDKLFFTDLSDIHIGHIGFDEAAFRNTLQVIKDTPNFYFFLGGDSLNHANKGSKSSQYEENLTPREQVYRLQELLEPVKDRCLGKIDGNHDTTRAKEFNDISPVEWFCDRTGIPYFREYALLHFSVNKNAYTHFIHHITGSTGKKQNLNKLQEKGEEWRCDVIWGEHTHRRQWGSEMYVDIDLRNRKPVLREQFYINANSFLRWSGYAKEKGYRLGRTGCKVVEMSGIPHKRGIRVYSTMQEFVDHNYQQ